MKHMQGGSTEYSCVAFGAATGVAISAAIGSFGWGVFYGLTANC